MRRALLVLVLALAAGCGGVVEAPQSNLPFEYTRPDVGAPVTAAARATATAQLQEILREVPYLTYVAERAHGWPQGAPGGGYWYGTWWSGVQVERQGQAVTFRHSDDGADNNGLRTAPLLEAACYAQALDPSPAHEALLRTLVRGFSSWSRAMARTSAPDAPPLLARAAYPAAVGYTSTAGLAVEIAYDNNRPGEDNGATEYVRIPDNPDWGDLWVKNKRSKDDIGYMLRAMDALDVCRASLGPEGQADVDEARARYAAWAAQVVQDGFTIATYDKDLNVYVPNESLAIFIQLANAECDAMLALRLTGLGDEGGLECGDGITEADGLAAALNPGNRRIFVSFHEALARLMVARGDPERARRILTGLARRSDETFAQMDAGELAERFNPSDFAGELVNAANVGVPLTSREVAYLHQRLAEAHAALLDPSTADARRAFAVDGVDGTYPLNLADAGFNFRELGVLLGLCASNRLNPASQPVLDCAALGAFP
jgi:hypothetical protein